MSGYLSSRKLTNVIGRINYITNEQKQENIIDYYNTTDNDFWKLLASESRTRYNETNPGGQCCEAREFIIGIPQNLNITARQVCDIFKDKYKVECTCAIHQNNKNGIVNKHCHLIFSERIKLEQPDIIQEKRASRNYYYDVKGVKCKKENAVKIVKKGDLIQKGSSRYFSNKNEFFKTQKFVYDCKELFLKDTFHLDWSLQNEKTNKELSQKHIGKNNPKAEYIQKNNHLKEIVKNVCNASDFIFEKENGETLKELKKDYEIKNFSATNFEENEYKIYSFVEEIQFNYKERVKNEVKEHNVINRDIGYLQTADNSSTMIKVQNIIINDYERETKSKEKSRVIEFLKNKLFNMVERIKKLISLQNEIYIEPKNQLELYQDSKNNNLYIEDQSHLKQHYKSENEYGIEL